MIGSVLSGAIAAIQGVVNLLVPLPANLITVKPWLGRWWLWLILAMVLLAYAQFHMWLDEHKALKQKELDLVAIHKAHDAEVAGLRRDFELFKGMTAASVNTNLRQTNVTGLNIATGDQEGVQD